MDEEDNATGMFTPNLANGAPTDIKFYNARTSDDPVVFRAFLNSFSDSYTANWNEKTVYARMDPIYTYQNTTRVISFEIAIPSYGIIEGRNNLDKLSRLVRMVYPSFTGQAAGHGLTNSPVIGIKFGNLITDTSGEQSRRGLFGVLGGIEVSPDTDAGFFMAGGDSGDMNLIPKLYVASFEFKPLHGHLLGDAPDNSAFSNFPYNMSDVTSAVSSDKSGQASLEGGGLSEMVSAFTALNLD